VFWHAASECHTGHAIHTFWRCFQRSAQTTEFGVSGESGVYRLVSNAALVRMFRPKRDRWRWRTLLRAGDLNLSRLGLLRVRKKDFQDAVRQLCGNSIMVNIVAQDERTQVVAFVIFLMD
jgi:hypothetical protein